MQEWLLVAEAQVKMRNPLAELVQQTGGAQNRRAGFHGLFMPVFLNSLSTPNPGSKPFSGGRRDQNIPHRPFYPAGFAGYITLGLYELGQAFQLRFLRIYVISSCCKLQRKNGEDDGTLRKSRRRLKRSWL